MGDDALMCSSLSAIINMYRWSDLIVYLTSYNTLKAISSVEITTNTGAFVSTRDVKAGQGSNTRVQEL